MKIADKIFLLVLFLIAALSINTFIALRQVAYLGDKLREVADKDIVLIDVGNSVSRNYLENAIRFQSLLNIGDELAFASMPSSRRQYLQSHIQKLKVSFDHLTQTTGESILKGKDLISRKLAKVENLSQVKEIENAGELLEKIETAYVEYDRLFNDIFKMITAGSYELSLDDLSRVHQKEKILADKITSLLADIQQSAQRTLLKASLEQEVARSSLFFGFIGIVLISLIMSIFLIRSFSRPLKDLVIAAQQIGGGNFKVKLDRNQRDEIGEVSNAFIKMSGQLDEFKREIEKQKDTLFENLKLTNEQKHDLERVNTELDRFVYTVSHDIAAPLTGIEGYGAFLEEHYFDKLDEKGQRSLTGLRRATKRLNDMIQDLLALTRISRIKNPYEKVDVNFLINQVLERLEYVVNQSRAQVIVACPITSIVCDRIKLTEVFVNLINNAIKFSSQDSHVPCIEIGGVEQKENFEFYVRDNGIGIAPEHHEEIFDVFRRLDNSAILEGTGAGLSIVKAGVEDHGGKVWVVSNLKEGATFYFSIPKNLKAALPKYASS